VGVCRMITQQRVDVVVDGGAVVGSSNYLLLLARDQRWRSACVLCDSAQGNGQDQWTVRWVRWVQVKVSAVMCWLRLAMRLRRERERSRNGWTNDVRLRLRMFCTAPISAPLAPLSGSLAVAYRRTLSRHMYGSRMSSSRPSSHFPRP
jgi:hypothetical protein